MFLMTTPLVTFYKFNKNKYQLPIFKNAPMNACPCIIVNNCDFISKECKKGDFLTCIL